MIPTDRRLIRGHVLALRSDPFAGDPEAALLDLPRGGVLIAGGRIAEVGDGAARARAHPDAAEEDIGDALILPAFVDCHVHYPQTAIVASWGARLIDWLNRYTFPEELRFADPAYARAQAERFLDLILAEGTASACVYATVHASSAEAIFAAAEARGLRLAAGKVLMDRNAPDRKSVV